MSKSVFGLVDSESQAEQIVENLKSAGFSSNDISVLFPDKGGTRDFAHEQHTKAPEGAATGAGAGGAVGGVLGWLVGIGSLAIPGVGPFIAAGPIMAALAGAGIGATVGGVSGALIGLGIPEYEAKRYEGKIKEGNILMSVHSENSEEKDRAKDIFEQAGAHDISYTEEQGVPDREAPKSGFRTAEDIARRGPEDRESSNVKAVADVEEVVVGKDLEERNETVRDTVRRKDVEVEEDRNLHKEDRR